MNKSISRVYLITLMVLCNLLFFTQNSALAASIQFDLEVNGYVEGTGMGENDFVEVNWDFTVANATPIINWTPPTLIGVYAEDKRIDINETLSWTGDFSPDALYLYSFDFRLDGDARTSDMGAEARWFLEGSLSTSGPIDEYAWLYRSGAEVDGLNITDSDSFPVKPPSTSAFVKPDPDEATEAGAHALSFTPFPENEGLLIAGTVAGLHTASSDARALVEFSAIPEPAAYLLLVAGLAGLVFLRRRMESGSGQ